jgi:hypothetical protein
MKAEVIVIRNVIGDREQLLQGCSNGLPESGRRTGIAPLGRRCRASTRTHEQPGQTENNPGRLAVVFDDVDAMPTKFGDVVENGAFGFVFGHTLWVSHALPSFVLVPERLKKQAARTFEGRKTWEKRDMMITGSDTP